MRKWIPSIKARYRIDFSIKIDYLLPPETATECCERQSRQNRMDAKAFEFSKMLEELLELYSKSPNK